MANLTTNPTQRGLAVSIGEAAQLIGLGRTRINELIKSGELPARKAGRRTLLLRADVETFLQNLPVIGR